MGRLVYWAVVGLSFVFLPRCCSYVCMIPARGHHRHSQYKDGGLHSHTKDGEGSIQPTKSSPSWTINIDPASLTFRKYLALLSAALGGLLYMSTLFQPASGVALLHIMEDESPVFKDVVCNGKPTIVDFYADWCESCKELAPRLRALQLQYRDKINFVTINGIGEGNERLVQLFKVDGIPHIAFVSARGDLALTLVGDIPKTVLGEQINILASDPVRSVQSAVSSDNNPSLCSSNGGGGITDLF